MTSIFLSYTHQFTLVFLMSHAPKDNLVDKGWSVSEEIPALHHKYWLGQKLECRDSSHALKWLTRGNTRGSENTAHTLILQNSTVINHRVLKLKKGECLCDINRKSQVNTHVAAMTGHLHQWKTERFHNFESPLTTHQHNRHRWSNSGL